MICFPIGIRDIHMTEDIFLGVPTISDTSICNQKNGLIYGTEEIARYKWWLEWPEMYKIRIPADKQ